MDDPPYQRHSETSRAAADAIVPATPTERRRVEEYVLSRREEGATDEEIQQALAMNPSTQRPRRVELVRAGLLADSGKTRLTQSGRSAVVWVALAFKDKPVKQGTFNFSNPQGA